MASRQPEPFPADPTGQRLCEVFGTYLWSFIQAEAPDDVTAKAQWQTITQYPLRPRALWALWQDANTLVGVRFGHETSYFLLDIDAGSAYCNPEGITQIRAALETIGVARTLLLRSSWHEGLHLYAPLPEAVSTFDLAVAIKECLQAQGLRLKQGQLEAFPNVKAYGVKTFIEYNGHRLPLQPGSGSCLLNDDLNPIGHNLASFFWQWDQAASHQDIETLYQACRIGRDNHRKKPKRRSHPVDNWRQDLDTEITEGWTDYGQTNHLLKTIACYGRVFERLEGQDLAAYIVRIATSRPGYQQYCRHQAEIERKAQTWARAAENYYWPLGTLGCRKTTAYQNNLVAFNRRQSEDAQHRIQTAYAHLEQSGELPTQITARVKAIAQVAHVSQQTLYKHLTLWHPDHQGEMNDVISVSAPTPTAESSPSESLEPLKTEGLHPVEEIMKGKPRSGPEFSPDPKLFTSGRGVWGDEGTFPQPAKTPSPIPWDELISALQRQVQRLGWTAAEAQQFIADRFDGRRRLQLKDDELVLLLYYLQDLEGS